MNPIDRIELNEDLNISSSDFMAIIHRVSLFILLLFEGESCIIFFILVMNFNYNSIFILVIYFFTKLFTIVYDTKHIQALRRNEILEKNFSCTNIVEQASMLLLIVLLIRYYPLF